METEKRGKPRQRTLKAGLIVFNDLRSTVECTIRNLTEGGARLKVASPIGIPDRFILQNTSDRTKRECEVVWRKATEIGVRFVQAQGEDAGKKPAT